MSTRKRSPISTLLAIIAVLVTMAVLFAMRVGSLFRQKYVPIAQLKFPVLVFQPGLAPFAEWDETSLQKFPEHSTRTPANGTIIIDSDFNQFTQENVLRQREGDLKAIARFLIPAMRIKYTFDLRRKKEKGREAAMNVIRECPPLSENQTEDTAMRSAAQTQTTFAAILDALHFYKPIQPATAPSMEPTTDQSAPDDSTPQTTEPEPGHDPDNPAHRN